MLLTQESTDAERMAAYPAYRQSLEARYPLVCEACKPRVEAQLEKSHQHVRSDALRYWIARHAAATTALAEREEAPVVRRFSTWHTAYAELVLSAGSMAPWCTALAFPSWLCMGSICLACLPTWWDCRAADKDRLDARTVRYEARGQRAWQAAQLSLWLLRLGSVYALLQGTHTTTLSALGLLHAMLCINAFASYRLVPQAPLHLALRATTPVAGAPPAPVTAPPPLAALSLADEPRVSAPLDTLWQESASSDAMDVDPEPAPPVQRDFSLAPPQFGGRMSSGLEDLFGQALRLETPSEAMPLSSRRVPPRWPWLIAGLSVGLFVAWKGPTWAQYDISTWAARWGRS